MDNVLLESTDCLIYPTQSAPAYFTDTQVVYVFFVSTLCGTRLPVASRCCVPLDKADF